MTEILLNMQKMTRTLTYIHNQFKIYGCESKRNLEDKTEQHKVFLSHICMSIHGYIETNTIHLKVHLSHKRKLPLEIKS